MANEIIELHELWVDGKLMKSWKGKRVPDGLSRLFKLRGVEHKIKHVNQDGRLTNA